MKVDYRKLKRLRMAQLRREWLRRPRNRAGMAAAALTVALGLTIAGTLPSLGPPGMEVQATEPASAQEPADLSRATVTTRPLMGTDMTKMLHMAGSRTSGVEIPEIEDIQELPDAQAEEMPSEAAPETPVEGRKEGLQEEPAAGQEEAAPEDAAPEGTAPEDAALEGTAPEDAARTAQEEGSPDGMPEPGQADSAASEAGQEPVMAASVVDGMVNVRAEASEDSETAGTLSKGTGGVVLERSDGWTRIQSGSFTGWVSDQWLIFGEEAKHILEQSVAKATIMAESLNVRGGPGTGYDILGTVRQGEVLELESVMDNGWVEVAWKGGTAYISSKYVDVDGTAPMTKAPLVGVSDDAMPKAQTVSAYEGSASELEMLATIIYCEAGNQPWEGKVAVGNVVLNRIASPQFPNDMDTVLRAPIQFTPVGSGKYDRMLNSGKVPQGCYDAAQAAMDGESYVGGCLYFKNPYIAGWHDGLLIGEHVFY